MATAFLRPSADISLNHSCSSGSTGYNLINEEVCDEDSTYISLSAYNTTESASSLFTCTGTIDNGAVISSVKAVVYAKNTSTSASNSTIQITVGSSSASALTLTATSYTALTYTLSTSCITVSGTAMSANLTLASSIKSGDKSTYYLRTSLVYIQVEYTVPIPESFSYIKLNGSWKKCKSFWIKQNGVWQILTTAPTGYNLLERKHNPWTFDKSFNHEAMIDSSGKIITELIPVTPDVELIVLGQGCNAGNTMWWAYKSDKTYYDYWGGSGTSITTVGGYTVYLRTLSAANMANTYYVSVTAVKEAYNYVKVTQNGVVLFDGSLYPYN